MLKINDVVVVQNKGICVVKDIKNNAFDGADPNKKYYVMKPIDTSNNMMVYLPVDTKIHIRPITSKTDAKKLYADFVNLDCIKIDAEETRFDVYNSITKNGGLEDRLKLIKTLLKRKSSSNKKQFNIQEQKYITTLLSCITSEIGYILSIPKAEIEEFIYNNFNK